MEKPASPPATESYNLPPGLKRPLYFYYHKPWVKLGSPILLFEHLHRTYGNIAHYRFMGTYIVFLNHPDYIREVLVNQASSFVKERTVRRMKVLLGEGLITSDDPIHKRQRRIAAPAFHRQRIAAYADKIAAIAAAWADRRRPNEVVDANAAMMELSLEIIASTLFDTEVTEDIRSINDEVNTIMGLYNFLVAMPRLESWLHWPLPILSRFRQARGRLNAVVDRIIHQRRAEMAADPSHRDRGDLLTMLIASRYEPLDPSQAESSKPKADSSLPKGASAVTSSDGMSDEQIRDEVLTIFLAGYETVANALTWTWYLLSQNPAAESQLHAELDAVLRLRTTKDLSFRPERSGAEKPVTLATAACAGGPGLAFETWDQKRQNSRLPNLTDYPNLPYTEQVFAEAMRLYPPAWAMGRMSTKPVTLGPYTIPAGAHFFFSQYIMHRSEEYFPDPLRFDPTRHTAEARAARPKFTYFPFGGGARQCIGESFAWMEGVLAIATIASRWRLSYLGDTPPIPQAKITLRPRDPLLMRLTQR